MRDSFENEKEKLDVHRAREQYVVLLSRLFWSPAINSLSLSQIADLIRRSLLHLQIHNYCSTAITRLSSLSKSQPFQISKVILDWFYYNLSANIRVFQLQKKKQSNKQKLQLHPKQKALTAERGSE